jgi:hypothetical protein
VSVGDALKVAGEEAVYCHARPTGVPNKRARSELGFTPRHSCGRLAQLSVAFSCQVNWR